MRNFLCNLSAGKLIITAAVAGGITLNPVVIATLTGVELTLKVVADLKKYVRKAEQANFARIEYQKIISDPILLQRRRSFRRKGLPG